ncbi:MAG: hypothetical protein J5648_02200 [Lachnospiraceae bacterium]|nr:hypothetical protein [Lachnospiraceae bacterium]
MKRLFTLVLVLVLSLCLSACANEESGKKEAKEEQKNQQEQKQKDTPAPANSKEEKKQSEDEMLAEEMRHVIEVLAYGEPDIYIALGKAIPSGETEVDVLRITQNGMEYCMDMPELKEWITDLYMDELSKFDRDVFKSEKYKAMEYMISFREKDDKTDGYQYEVVGEWK